MKGWDTETGLCKTEFSCPRNIVTSLIIERQTESSLFQGSEDLCVRVWDTRSNSKQPNMLLNSFVYFPLSLDLDPRGNYLAAGNLVMLSILPTSVMYNSRTFLLNFTLPLVELKTFIFYYSIILYFRLCFCSKNDFIFC